jgi:L-asparaginase / beta-aspartyl-peptidase
MGRLKAAVLTGGFCLAAVHVSVAAGGPQEARPAGPVGIVIHGGEGVKPRSEMTPESEREYRKALEQAVLAGWEVLRNGGTSVSAVEAAIRVMEDSPLFNAGRGASFNRAGFNELDAAIMDGATLKAGAVAVVRKVRNPISLARLVMERSPHVLLAGEGAESFALEQGMALVPPSYFFTEHKWRSLQLRLQQETPYGQKPVIKGSDRDPALFGTVGAAALDRAGNLAAGTSTGGREGKLPGRVGDSPIPGAGTYASNESLAVSSTGLGEYVLRLGSTKEASDHMVIGGKNVTEATEIVRAKLEKMGGSIGMVAIDRKGIVAMPFTGDGMYRAYVLSDGKPVVKIYRE